MAMSRVRSSYRLLPQSFVEKLSSWSEIKVMKSFRHQFKQIPSRKLSSSTKITDKSCDGLVVTRVDERSKVANLILNRPPVNSLSLEMCTAISSAIKNIEIENPEVQSLILSSSNPSILSAGLDLMELNNPSSDRLPKFWNSFQQLYLDLYGSRLALIAAIEGHAPAAGCMLAMACDYRIMAVDDGNKSANPTIGLNETRFGITAPSWLGELMIRTIGFRNAEQALQLGTLFTPKEALNVGLVDEIVAKESVLEKCQETALFWSNLPPHARVSSKMLARKRFIDDLTSPTRRREDTEHFCNFIQSDEVQHGLTLYLAKLKHKE